MQSLTLLFFLELGLLAVVVPPVVQMVRSRRAKAMAALGGPLILLPVVLVAVGTGLLKGNAVSQSAWLASLRLQVLAIAFAAALGGVTVLLGRRWPLQAPAIVAIAALVTLSTPLWGNPLLGLSGERLRPLVSSVGAAPEEIRPGLVRVLSSVNPLLTVSEEMGYDWVRSPRVIYQHTRMGTDLAFTAAGWLSLAAVYLLLAVVSSGLSLLVRDREQPSLYLPPKED